MSTTDVDGLSLVLECREICKSYQSGSEKLHILRDMDFSLPSGQSVSIMGSSGAGKSTMLNILGGLDRPDSGSVSLLGQPLSDGGENARARLRNQYLGFVYQFHHLLPEFSALENVAMPLVLGGMSMAQAKPRAMEMLAAVALDSRSEHRPSRLSGGERQRVAIARALVTRPQCVLMDEPTGNLDKANAEAVLDLIFSMQKQFSVALVLVTHDPQIATQMDRCLVLKDGNLSTP